MRCPPRQPVSLRRARYNRVLMPMGHGHRGLTLLFALLLSLLTGAPAVATVQMDVTVGWSNRFRPGRWTPLYVTLAESAPRQVVIDIYSPTDRRYALRASQGLATGPSPVTVALYAPLSYRVDEAVVTVRDATSGKRLADFVLSDYPAYPGSAMRGPEAIDSAAIFAGISGSPDGQRLLESQIAHNTIRTALIPQPLMPAVAVGYDSLDLLVLNQPYLNLQRTLDQQRAIADWVRAGGTLIIIPGPDPFPRAGPLAELLPCSI